MTPTIHILEHSLPNFKFSRPFSQFSDTCLNPKGIGGDEAMIHNNWESVVKSGATHVFYFYPFEKGKKPLEGIRDALPHGRDIDSEGDGKPVGIKQIRGSRYFKDGIEIIPTFHPQTTYGSYVNWWLIRLDFNRLWRDLHTPYNYPEFNITICWDFQTALAKIKECYQQEIIDGDIEGSLDIGGCTCVGFAFGQREAFTIPFCDLDGNPVFSLDEETIIWNELNSMMKKVKTCWQNGCYDLFVLSYGHGILVENYHEDTMLKHWELYCELPKSLGFQVSYYTDAPFYKDERTAGELEAELIYNGKDCCLTRECREKQEALLIKDTGSYSHYRFNMEGQLQLLYLMLCGLWIEPRVKKELLRKAKDEVARLQRIVDADYLETPLGHELIEKYQLAGVELNDLICKLEVELKNYREKYQEKPLKKWLNKIAVTERKIYRAKVNLAKWKNPNFKASSPNQKKLETPSINVKSSKAKDQYLYSAKGLKLKKPAKKLAENNDGEEKTATEGIIIIKKMVNKGTPEKVKVKLQNLLLLINARTNVSDIQKLTTDPLDGRIRASYTICGTDTGRMSCKSSNIPLKGFNNIVKR